MPKNSKVPLAQALASITSRAAAVLGQSASLAVGAAADICVFDPQAANAINQNAAFAQLTPFAHEVSGFALSGAVRSTLVGGRVVYRA